MKVICLVLVMLVLVGCNRETDDSIKLLSIEQMVQTKMIQSQNKVIVDLTKAIESLEREIKSIKKWK